MAKVQYDYVERIRQMLRDDAKILDAGNFEIRDHLAQAVKTYQKHKPYEKLWELTGNGSSSYSLPADWKERYSEILQVEYPVYTSGLPNYLKGTDWGIIRDSTGYKLRFYFISIPSGQKANVTYSTFHVLNDTQSTIYEDDFDALCSLTAALACGTLAQYYAQTSKPSLNVDVSDYEDKGRIYSERAEIFMKAYQDHIATWGCEFPEMDFEGVFYREPIFHSSDRR